MAGGGAGSGAPSVHVSARVFEEWFATHGPQIYRYAARRLGPSTAEDITATVFVEAWASRETFDPERGSGRAWLFGIATNLISRHHRSERRQLRAFARTGVDPVATEGLDDVVDRLAAEAQGPTIARALLRLRSVDRDLFWLSVAGDLTYAEMAEITGVPIGTVRSRLSRARAQLRAEVPGETGLDGDGATEGPP